MTTTTHGHFYPATSYTSGWRQADQDQADAANNLFQVHAFQWADSSARSAQSGMVEGDIGYQADTDTYYQYTGSAWQLMALGLAVGSNMVRGATVSYTGTSASMDANGKVTFTSCTVLTVYGLSADYDVYEYDLSSIGTAASATLQLTNSSGTANASSVYDRTENLARNGTTSSATSVAQTAWAVMGMVNTNHQMKFTIAGLCAARETSLIGLAGVHADPAVQNTTNGLITQYATHRNATAYYGLALTFTAAQTGTLRIRATL